MIKGQCNCGAVSFEINNDTSEVYVCHCSICRKSTGTNGIAVILVNKQDFTWTQGQEQISTWKKTDSEWQTWFCKQCGSPLPGNNDHNEMQKFVPAGLITEGGESLKVAHHFYVDSKTAWDEIGDSGKQHPSGYSG